MAENLENTNVEQGQEVTETAKTYTEEEVQALLQKEGDRRISQYQKTMEKRNRESEKLKNMTDTERYEYGLQEKERQLEEREHQLLLAENKTVACQILSDKGLDLSLVDFVLADDADTMDKNIKALDKAFKRSVAEEVKKRIGGNAPVKTQTDPEAITKEQFRKMSLNEKQDLYLNNPDVYKALTK